MKKIKRLLTIALTALFVFGAFCVSACQSMEDIIPETYGEWEQNYLYRGNAKTKTTGEDYEKLVKTVEIDGVPLNAIYCLDSKIHGDDMYMLLVCQKDGEDLTADHYTSGWWKSRLEVVHCLVSYNIKDKTQKLLTTDQKIEVEDKEWFYRPMEIEGIFDDCILLCANIQEANTMGKEMWSNTIAWYTVDFDGALLEPDIEYANEWEWVSDEYLVAEMYNVDAHAYELYYRTSDLSERTFVYRKLAGSGDFEWAYIEQNGVKGLLIQEYYSVTSPYYGSRMLGYLYFYNFDTDTMSEAVSVCSYAKFYGDYNYIKTYEYYKTYYRSSLKEGQKSVDVETNNALHRLVYDENGVHLEEFFDLTDGHNYTIYGIHGDKILYRDSWYQDHYGCFSGGSKYTYCEWDLTTGKGKKVDDDAITDMEDEYSAWYEQEKGITVGDYIYFLHEESISEGLMMPRSRAYMLKRRNVQTNELEVMQLWHEEDNDGEDGRKFCEEFWFVCENDAKEFNFYEFTARAY